MYHLETAAHVCLLSLRFKRLFKVDATEHEKLHWLHLWDLSQPCHQMAHEIAWLRGLQKGHIAAFVMFLSSAFFHR